MRENPTGKDTASTGYTGLRPYFLYSPATYKIVGTDVKMAPSQNIAYIQGSGDDVPAALEALGLHVSFLSSQDLAGADLGKYDSIIVGVRAYAVRPDLIANNARLLKYVEDGGVVMVQYNTPEFDHNFGPYPYVMTDDPEEVTDENSVVTILDPKDPLLNWPNAITPKDFDGWIEERGSKFLSSWDPGTSPCWRPMTKGSRRRRVGLSMHVTARASTFIMPTPSIASCPWVFRALIASLPICSACQEIRKCARQK